MCSIFCHLYLIFGLFKIFLIILTFMENMATFLKLVLIKAMVPINSFLIQCFRFFSTIFYSNWKPENFATNIFLLNPWILHLYWMQYGKSYTNRSIYSNFYLNAWADSIRTIDQTQSFQLTLKTELA